MLFARDFLSDQQVLSSVSAPISPTVSIILPTHRRRNLLERSITCVLNQSYKDFELIVMDDGSYDGSNELIENFRSVDPRIIHVRHEMNCGLPAIRVNEGIELAKGKYLAFQFDDDVWRSNALEDLVNEAQKYQEPVVVIGQALFYTKVGNHVLPAKDIDLVSLLDINKIANNSVLFSRSLVFEYGMYDPHIGMRRLCDWDLWLRLIKNVNFITVKKIVSEVFESNEGAIGVTVPWDLHLFRFLNSIPRDYLLTPDKWRNYELDSLKIAGAEIKGDFRRRLYEEQIVPYYFKFRHFFPQLASFSASLPSAKEKSILYTKQSFDVCNEVTINNYAELTQERKSYQTYFQILGEIKPLWQKEADILLLMRTVEDQALQLSKQALESNLPSALYLDDDLFTFHEYGTQYNYLAPRTPYYNNLCKISKNVDAVLVTNQFIGKSVYPHNPRIIPHNNCVRESFLPSHVHKRGEHQLRIGYAGSQYRIEEFSKIWKALEEISKNYKDRISFEFWGLDTKSLAGLSSPVIQKPFTFSYPYYLNRLKNGNFDILLTPMLDYPTPRLAKSLIKYYETAVAGALGIFSDVVQYQSLPAGLTCLKAGNETDAWYETIVDAIEMDVEEFDTMRTRCLEHVREEYTERAQIDLHEAALRAIEFHKLTREARYQDSMPRVMYVLHSANFGGAEIQLLRRLRLMKNYGVQPVVIIPSVLQDTENAIRLRQELEAENIILNAVEYTCFTEPRSPKEFFSTLEREQIKDLLLRWKPALVHTVTFIPSFGQMCDEMKIPHVSTLYAVQDDFSWQDKDPGFSHCSVVQSDSLRYAKRWGELLNTHHVCARDNAPQSLFSLGQVKYLQGIHQKQQPNPERIINMVVLGTFQDRKQQLETIEALGRLKQNGFDHFKLQLFGYTHFFPDYTKKCHQAIKQWGLDNYVFIEEFTNNIEQVFSDADILLSLSTYESFPGSIKDAFAAGVLVVATPVGGVSELVIDNITGILCEGTSVEALVQGIQRALDLSAEDAYSIRQQARKIARLELHPYRTANDLFRIYNLAIEKSNLGVESKLDVYPALSNVDYQLISGDLTTKGGLANYVSPTGPARSSQPIGAGLIYELAIERSNWSGFDLMIGTHLKLANGNLVIQIKTQSGNLMRDMSIDLVKVRDNDWLEIRFPPIANSENQIFTIELSVKDPTRKTVLSIYQAEPHQARPIYLAQRLIQKLGFRIKSSHLYCRIWYN